MAGTTQLIAPFTQLGTYHLLTYGTLLGTEMYQTFVMTKVCFQALPISAFMKLQMRVFPIYFKLQTGLLLLTAITYPHYGPISLLSSKNDMVTLSVAGLLALSNMLVYGPATERATVDRNLWSGREESNPVSTTSAEEKWKKRREFSRNHAKSIHLNLLAIAATVWYGIRLAAKLHFSVE